MRRLKGVLKVDNEKKNNPERPFSTFDWSNMIDPNVSRPKDITSDMWVPISAGKSRPDRRPSGNLVDRQKELKNTAKSSGSKKKTTQKRGSGKSARPPEKKKPQSAKAAQKKAPPAARKESAKAGERQKSAPQENERRKAARERQAELERARRRRAYENEKRQYEKESESYNRQRYRGSSREELSRKRAGKKRRSKSFYAVTITAGVLLVAVIATLVYCFAVGSPITAIEVSGKSAYSANEVVSACGVITGENIFTVSEKKVDAVLRKALPYIGSVKIKCNFPDRLVLNVTATSEKYLISGKNSYICLDKDEKILSVKKQKTRSGVYRFDGFKGQSVQPGEIYTPCKEDEQRFESAKRIVAALESSEIKKANVIKLDSTDNIVVVYDSRFNIFLGTVDNAENKLSLAANVIKSSVTKSNTGYIDVRYDSRAYFNEGKMNPN